MQVYGAPSYLSRRGGPKRAEDLALHDWVTFLDVEPRWLDGRAGMSCSPAMDTFVATRPKGVRAAIRAGGGLGILPSFLAESDVASGALVPVLPKWVLRTGDLWFVCPSGRQIPRKVTAFRAFVIEQLATRAALAL